MKKYLFVLLVVSTFKVASQDWKKSIETVLDSLEESNKASISIGIIHQSQAYKRSIGFRDIENAELATSSTKYRIASLTKQFVGHAIKELINGRRIALDNPVSKYLPEVQIPDLRIRHLLSHQSGLPEYWPLENYLDRDFNQRNDVVKVIADLTHTNFKPGDFYQYCNTNYVLLYEIIDRLTNSNTSSFLKENVFGPFGMNDSFIPEAEQPIRGFAKRYHFKNNKYTLVENRISNIVGDGGLVTTMDDMMNYASHMISSDRFYEPGYRGGFFSSGNGYLEHGGGSIGISTFIVLDNANQFALVVLSNSDQTSAEQVARAIQKVFGFTQEVDISTPLINEMEINISGTWFGFINKSPGILELNVNPDVGILKSNNGEFELKKSMYNIYNFKVAPIKLAFNKDKDIALLYLGHNTIGQIQKLRVMEDSSIVKEGLYRSAHHGVLKISKNRLLSVNGIELEMLSKNLYKGDNKIYRFGADGITAYSNTLWEIGYREE